MGTQFFVGDSRHGDSLDPTGEVLALSRKVRVYLGMNVEKAHLVVKW